MTSSAQLVIKDGTEDQPSTNHDDGIAVTSSPPSEPVHPTIFLPPPRAPDPVTSAVGDFGKWQMKVAGLASVAAMFTAWSTLSIAFLAPSVDHWCAKPAQLANLSEQEWKEMAIPVVSSDVRNET